MDNYKTIAINIYISYFLKDRISDFENRIVKAKKDCIVYIQKQIDLKTNNDDDLVYWYNVKNEAENI